MFRRRVDLTVLWSLCEMFDIGGFLTSMGFLGQLASILTAILTALVGDFITNLFASF